MRMWRWCKATALCGVVASGVLSGGTATGQTYINWSQYLYSGSHSSYNAATTTITPANAANLTKAWKFQPPSPTGLTGLKGFLSSPTVYNGVIYIGARNGYFYAISESTGAVIWQKFIGYQPKKTCGPEGFTSTATIAPDPSTGNPTIYVYGATGYLYALNTTDGSEVWPPAVVAIPSTTQSDYYAWSSPLVFKGRIYIGISSECDRPLVRGGLDAFDQATGALKNTFWTTPAGTRGASIWSSAATDGNSVFVTTGNGPTSSDGFSVIRLSASLGRQLGIWTVPLADRTGDADFGGSPGFWTAIINGVQTTMVGACNKNGDFYAFIAADISAGPVWTDQIGNSFKVGPGECDAAPVWNGTNLYLASNGTTINGTAYGGSIREVDPASGAVIWQTGLAGPIIGTPSEDGAGVIATATFSPRTGQNAVSLLNASTGKIRKTISYTHSNTFSQPVFADNYLIVASLTMGLRAYTVSG